MSDHEMHTGSDPSDLRHGAQPKMLDNGDHIGNDMQEPIRLAMADFVPRNPWPFAEEKPDELSRPVYDGQGNRVGDEINHPHAQRPEFPGRAVQALQWHNGRGDAITNLAQFDWKYAAAMPNVELRTIHAHLMEAVAQARTEMRERGMVVDF